MPKKDFAKLGLNLVEVASSQPSLRAPAAALTVVPTAPEPAPEPAPVTETAPAAAVATSVKPKAAPAAKNDPLVQQAFALRGSLRKILRRKAAEADQTLSGYILEALRARGLPVTDADIADGRKTRHG